MTLEVTESVLLQDRSNALAVLQSLKHIGVHLALDDFGTGSSSLTHLRDFPVDIVKIDRAFVTDVGEETTSHHIVAAVVTLAHRLGMSVVAEGVEIEDDYESVLALGCDSFQGFYFSPSVSTEDFDLLLA